MNEESLFIEAVEIRDPSERAAFLDRACTGDAAVRGRLERLLDQHEKAGSFLAGPVAAIEATGAFTPPPEVATVAAVSRERAGTMIGPYKLLQQIGEGGMGTVYMAEQTEPVKRKVALKIIKEGMDSKQVIARFEAERQALAMMDHVNIARVFDGGTTEPEAQARDGASGLASASGSGRPYFVMELVHGVPITNYCDDNHLTPRERLELFVPVCQAIQHAHQKGIIHRDIKPSNVMITLYDGKPVPKVIDFGVAKATEQKLTERTLFTQYGTMVGTLEYMSPEQAEMSALGVDTRSDIYSLGVLLYELLTGSTPLTHKRMKLAAYAEILRMIKEEEPPRPSTRLSDSGEALASISALRKTEPAKLTKLVRGELDWIVMKTLEKDRNRRYETAKDFAADVQRYLGDEPVQACPPSAGYRLRKFARRNKGPVVAAALVLLTLVGGIVGTSFGLVRAEKAREAEAERADAERRAKLEAEDREAETRAMLDFVENGILVARLVEPVQGPDRDEKAMLRRAVDEALPFVDRFKDRPLIEARLRLTLAAAFHNLNEFPRAVEQAQTSHALYAKHRGPDHPDTLAAMNSLAFLYSGDNRRPDALKVLGDMLALQKESLGPDHPDTLATMLKMAENYDATNQPADALRLRKGVLSLLAERKAALEPGHVRTLTALTELAEGQPTPPYGPESNLKFLEEVLAVQKAKFGPDHVATLGTMSRMADRYGLERPAEAFKLLRESLAIQKVKPGPDDANTIWTMRRLADLHTKLKQHEDAFKLLHEVLAIQKVKPGPDHPDTIATMEHLADRYDALRRIKEGLKLREELLAIKKTVGAGLDPATLVTSGMLADRFATMDKVADGHTTLGQHAEALQLREEVLKVRKAKFPAADQLETLASMTRVADSYAALGRHAEAEAHYAQSLELYKGLIIKNQREPKYFQHLAAVTAAKLGEVQLLGTRKVEEAEARFAEAVKLCDCSEVHCRIGNAYARHSQWKKAEDAFRTALDRNPKYAAYGNLAQALRNQGKVPEAINAYEKAIELEPKNAAHHINLGGLLCDVLKEYDKAIECFRKAIVLDPKLANARQGLGIALTKKSLSLVSSPDPKARDPKRAIEAAREAVELDPRSIHAWQYLGWARYRAGDWPGSIEALEKSCKLENGGDYGQWFVMALAHARLAAQDGLPEKERDHHHAEARRRYEQAEKQAGALGVRPPAGGMPQALWDFRAEARELIGPKDGKK